MNLEDSISGVIQQKLTDGTIENIIAAKLEKGINEAMEDLFRGYGDVGKTIKDKVKEVLIPAIEKHDFSDHIVKLDTVLTEIVNSTTLVENKTLLENFKDLMVEEDIKEIKTSDLFEKWCEFVAKEVETSGLEVNIDDGNPTYESVNCIMKVEHVNGRGWSDFEKANIVFECIGNKVNKLIAACNEMYENTNNEAYIAVIFNLYCGLRVGELVALKKSDVSFERNYLSVEREEVRVRIPQSDGSMKYERRIEEHTKTYTSRYIPLIPKAIDILENIISKHEQERVKCDYLFVKDGSHLNTNCVGNALRRACSKANITQKSTHKIRKTFASKLDANGVPTDEIRILLGHTDTQTTLGYIYNPLPKDETLDMIRNAF